jgi:hypothetical protein
MTPDDARAGIEILFSRLRDGDRKAIEAAFAAHEPSWRRL